MSGARFATSADGSLRCTQCGLYPPHPLEPTPCACHEARADQPEADVEELREFHVEERAS